MGVSKSKPNPNKCGGGDTQDPSGAGAPGVMNAKKSKQIKEYIHVKLSPNEQVGPKYKNGL